MLYFFEVDDEEMLKRMYRFRYDIVCEELGFFDKERYPDKMESDEYDEFADHFVAVDKDFNIAATIRYIHHSPIGYPTPKHLKIYPDIKELIEVLKQDKIAEISRVFIDKKYRNMSDTKYIMENFVKRRIYFKMRDYGVDLSYAAIEKRFRRLLKMYRIHFEPIGDLQEGYGSARYPTILHTKIVEKYNPHLKELYERRRWYLKN